MHKRKPEFQKIQSKRINWGKKAAILPTLDLIKVQRESYQWFITQGIEDLLQEISPVEDFTGKNWNSIINTKRKINAIIKKINTIINMLKGFIFKKFICIYKISYLCYDPTQLSVWLFLSYVF